MANLPEIKSILSYLILLQIIKYFSLKFLFAVPYKIKEFKFITYCPQWAFMHSYLQFKLELVH